MFYTIQNLPNYEINEFGVIRNKKNNKIKSQYISSNGYYMISIRIGERSKPYRVHRLLAQAFIPNPMNKPHVNHIDGNKLNNYLDNLEWCTHKENIKHAVYNGLMNNRGEKNGMSKLTEEKVARIKKMLADGISQYKIAKEIGGISRSAILNIKIRNQWKHVEPSK